MTLELDYQISSTMIDTCDLKLHGIHFKNACTNAKRCDSERAAFNLRADANKTYQSPIPIAHSAIAVITTQRPQVSEVHSRYHNSKFSSQGVNTAQHLSTAVVIAEQKNWPNWAGCAGKKHPALAIKNTPHQCHIRGRGFGREAVCVRSFLTELVRGLTA